MKFAFVETEFFITQFDILPLYLGVYDKRQLILLFETLNNEISANKREGAKIEENVRFFLEQLISLQGTYDDVVCKYGELDDSSIYEKVFLVNTDKKVKKLTKIKNNKKTDI